MTKPVDDVVETPIDRRVHLIPEKNKAKIEKEAQGLEAKLRWTHLSDGQKETLRIRLEALRQELVSL